MDERLVLFVTAPNAETAAAIARALVEGRLAACVSIVPAIRSIYAWQGKIEDEAESLLVVKTTAARVEAAKARVLALHPYSVPEIIALPIVAGHQAYLDWLTAETREEA
ncbi:MAG: divalent-cation tolerance protein CutA [Myxococcales bacterium]|nr:MAG: divalent-cation tolerance protein CutA [Myxococcales bacterium]